MYQTRLFVSSLFLTLFLTFNLSGQKANYQQAIQEKLDHFIELSNNQKWAEAFDLLYPKLFQAVGKHELIAMMEEMADEGMRSTTEDFQVVSFSEVQSFEDEDFVMVQYDSKQNLKMSSSITDDDSMLQTLLINLRQSMGEDNVEYDAATKLFLIKGLKSMYAISKKNENNWFLLENNPAQGELLEQLIPTVIRKEFEQ